MTSAHPVTRRGWAPLTGQSLLLHRSWTVARENAHVDRMQSRVAVNGGEHRVDIVVRRTDPEVTVSRLVALKGREVPLQTGRSYVHAASKT